MKFIQIVEQSGDIEEARSEIEGYFESTGDDTKVKKLTLCTDRDAPDKILSIVEFESWDTASDNNDLEATQEGAAKEQAASNVTYRNLDAHHEWVR
mgnify:FL=1|tara:strand:+ start:9436 stop:9723 length:288 start_codon:yes stop_codon:yes gene_type:complete